jgi:hypothetical protein
MPIPPEIVPSWEFNWHQVVDAHTQWTLLEQLFGKSNKRMELLAGDASNFFAVVQRTFLLDIQLTLSKLGDAAKTGRFDNMTLAKLADEIEQLYPKPLVESTDWFLGQLAIRMAEFSRSSCKVRERRNKFLAHLDYSVALGTHPVTLETPTRKEIEEALDSLRSVMREVERFFEEAATAYGHVVTIHDGDDLVDLLKRAARYRELVESEKISWDDWTQSPWANA